MTRTATVLRTATALRTFGLVAVVAVVTALGASRAYADDPRERQCQPNVEAAVRAALPTATSVRCPVIGPEYRIVNGQSVLLPAETITAEAALSDGRLATVALAIDDAVKANAARPEQARPGIRSITYQHSDLTGSSGKGMALMFWAFALISVVGALFVISRRNLIAAVMGMVGSFLGIAAIYMMLYAQFLAVIQMLVYAGAIMVLFVFVVMILNRPEDEPVAPSGRAGQALGGLAILYLVARLIGMLVRVEPPNMKLAMSAPLPTAQGHDWGSISAVGTDLFGPGIFPFEAISILLLLAVVGAIAIARPLHAGSNNAGDGPDDDAGDPARTIGGGTV
jgi:NADH-quinone oxidoreductase subunit J